MDKEQTKELLIALRLIIVGLFFWIIKPKFLTLFIFPENYFLNIFGFEIIGTIIIMIGLFIIYRVYPFAYSIISNLYIVIIFVVNILDFIFYYNKGYKIFQQYNYFLLSIMIVFLSKLMKEGLKHFGNIDLARKWQNFSIIIFFGYTIPSYLFVTMKNFGFINLNGIVVNKQFLLTLMPFIIVIFICFLYYIFYLVKSFNYLSDIQKKFENTKKKIAN